MKTGFLGKGILAILTIVLVLPEADAAAARRTAKKMLIPRFHFKIDPKASFAELLPAAPKAQLLRPYPDKLADVPEVAFGEMPLPESKETKHSEQSKNAQGKEDSGRGSREVSNMERLAHTIAKINHLNKHRPDYFMHVLLRERRDLDGLPFLMGEACRMPTARQRPFRIAVRAVEAALDFRAMTENGVAHPDEAFWTRYNAVCNEMSEGSRATPCDPGLLKQNRIGALMQMLGPKSPEMLTGLVKHLATIEDAESTQALARLAIYSSHADIRSAAIEALKARDEQEYTAILLEGLRYPWPAVAENAADAIARLQRIDLVDQLVEMLDQPDPRDPVTEDSGKHKITVVRDLVRINHHRNCLLCHAPGNTDDVSQEVVTGAMPVPGESFDSRSSRYGGSPDILVRADVTYLRQDFSEMQSVANAAPWPALQRFDFLVRMRTLSAEEAAAYSAIARRGTDYVSPYQRAIAAALRELQP